MSRVGELAVVQLELLKDMLPGSKLLGWPKRKNTQRKEILPPDIELEDTRSAGRMVLPNFVANVKERRVSIEFAPAPTENTWWLNCYVWGQMTLPLIVTMADAEWHTRGGLVPVFDFTIGDEMFDSLYIAASSKPVVAKAFLEDVKNRDVILSAGRFTRFSIDKRFVRITRLLSDSAPADAQEWLEMINRMIAIAQHVEQWDSGTDAWE